MTCRSWRFAPGAAAWVKVGKNAHLSVWPGASGWCLKWYYWLVFFCWFKAGPSAGAFFPGICDSIWALSIYRLNEHLLLSVWGICVIVFYCIPDASESCCAVAAGKKNQQLLSIQSFRRQCAPELIWQKKSFYKTPTVIDHLMCDLTQQTQSSFSKKPLMINLSSPPPCFVCVVFISSPNESSGNYLRSALAMLCTTKTRKWSYTTVSSDVSRTLLLLQKLSDELMTHNEKEMFKVTGCEMGTWFQRDKWIKPCFRVILLFRLHYSLFEATFRGRADVHWRVWSLINANISHFHHHVISHKFWVASNILCFGKD